MFEEKLAEMAKEKLLQEAREVRNELNEGSQIGIAAGYWGHDVSPELNLLILELLDEYIEGAE